MIVYSKKATDTPASLLIAHGWRELMLAGFMHHNRGDSPVDWENQVLYYQEDDRKEITGVLCFRHFEFINQYFITLGYVHPEFRRCGIYRELYNAIVKRAQDNGITRIAGAVHANNKAMQNVMSKLGRELIAFMYESRVS